MTDTDTTDTDTSDTDTTETDTTETDGEIGPKMDRIREIVVQLEDGEVSLERANELREEGKELLAEVEDHLDLGDASVIERE